MNVVEEDTRIEQELLRSTSAGGALKAWSWRGPRSPNNGHPCPLPSTVGEYEMRR